MSLLDEDGWFPTRDRGWIDEDGYLFIEGRADDTIIRGGENIAPAEIEDVSLSHDGIVDAVVVGLPDDQWGQRLVAVVVAQPGARGRVPRAAGLGARPPPVLQDTRGHRVLARTASYRHREAAATDGGQPPERRVARARWGQSGAVATGATTLRASSAGTPRSGRSLSFEMKWCTLFSSSLRMSGLLGLVGLVEGHPGPAVAQVLQPGPSGGLGPQGFADGVVAPADRAFGLRDPLPRVGDPTRTAGTSVPGTCSDGPARCRLVARMEDLDGHRVGLDVPAACTPRGRPTPPRALPSTVKSNCGPARCPLLARCVVPPVVSDGGRKVRRSRMLRRTGSGGVRPTVGDGRRRRRS